MENFELRFVKNLPEDDDNFSLILKDKRYNGWFRYVLDSGGFIDLIVRFRMPKTIPLYDDVARNFLPEERLVGVHRMLVGKDLQEETKDILNFNSVNDYVASLDDSEVKKLLNRMKNMVTFDCNKIPYLHIRMEKSLNKREEDYYPTIKEYINRSPNFLKIFYDVLNEKISMKEATKLSEGSIFSEYLELIKQ